MGFLVEKQGAAQISNGNIPKILICNDKNQEDIVLLVLPEKQRYILSKIKIDNFKNYYKKREKLLL